MGFFIASMEVFFYFESPYIQVLALPLLLLSANFFIGTYVTRNFSKTDNMTLPFVDLFSSDEDLILDAGCGSGRGTIELSKVSKNGQIVALDLFESGEDIASRKLLEKNLEIAEITGRVRIVKGDVTNLEFENNTFNTVISVLLLNNLGKAKITGLKELFRVLKPGGKILIIVPTPSLQTFAVMSVFSLILTSNKEWRSLFEQVGFRLLDEGVINFGRFFLLQK
ncbi:MAG: class I SAM-dependent methyltransferase [Methanobacterium sp.]|uniref:class I SAM-dependent methyltransferase n=1 Tax=Methanobacterium sp. TaxID=2164 RepID=UPI003D6513ED|nr:class I SAM-dependent methyltransferase [Methanobacterium sp.]